MEPFLSIIILVLLLINLILIIVFRSKNIKELPTLQAKITDIQSNLLKLESNFKEDFRINREENAGIAKDNRQELNSTLKSITEQSQTALKEINNEKLIKNTRWLIEEAKEIEKSL